MDNLKSIKTLSIIIPVYNEEKTLSAVLEKVNKVILPDSISKQIIIVDDGSSDNSIREAEEFIQSNPGYNIELIHSDFNKGKGAAVRMGLERVKGEFLIVQDADLEYDPDEYQLLLKPVIEGHADVVYGSRFRGNNPHRILFFWHTMGNKFLTFLSNLFCNLNLTDMETCYKLINTEVIKKIKLKENRFGFEPEITTKISKVKDVRIYEVGISYYGRKFREGKKINWKDGFHAIWCIIKYNIFS